MKAHQNPVEAAPSTPAASTAPRDPAGVETTVDRAAAPHPGGHQAGPVQAAPRQGHPHSSRGVNATHDGTDRDTDARTQDPAAGPKAGRTGPAPLLANQTVLWAITILAGAAYAALTTWFLLKGPRP